MRSKRTLGLFNSSYSRVRKNYEYPELKGGKFLPLVESFYTIQGEGFNTGKPAYFIRLGGCDVGCSWCDSKESWNPEKFPPVDIDVIVKEAVKCPAKAIVLTGGEPLNYPLDSLCNALRKNGLQIFLETSGSSPLSGVFDWICLSPKKKKKPLPGIYPVASELKVIIEGAEDFEWAEYNRKLVGEKCRLYLQPEWSRMKTVMPLIVEYVKMHPEWNVSLQTHKFMRIP
jgi:7-carboxy-7-deazaguanine synthase